MAEIEHLKELITPSRSSTESFESLETTCKFLIMAINRSQDYVKASSNIALTPILDTVNVREVLGIVQKCIVNTKCGRIVNVHPLGDVCAFLITDHHYLTENLLCLVSNASKYSDRGAVIDVRLSLLPPPETDGKPDNKVDGKADDEVDRMVLVTVEDNGIGITETAQQLLFQPFKQAQRSAGGTGLGLFSLSKRIEAMNGTCGVRNRSDGKQGSVFWFTFPYRPDLAALEEYEAALTGNVTARRSGNTNDTQRSTDNKIGGRSGKSDAISPNNPTTLPPLRILLTDDSPSILKVTTRFLEKAGHTVETADNGNQSLERLKVARDSFDVHITDLQMPVMDGYESVRRYRGMLISVFFMTFMMFSSRLNDFVHTSQNVFP